MGLPIRTPSRKIRYCQNSMPEAGEMAQWVKGSLHKHEGLSSNRQSPREVKGGSGDCTSRVSVVRWWAEPGAFPAAHRPASRVYSVADNRKALPPARQKGGSSPEGVL